MPHTISDMLAQAEVLRGISDSWRLDAELLLAEAMQCSRTTLLVGPERTVNEDQQGKFEADIMRRRRGEPVAYILGNKGFMDFELSVDSRVLIPRPETELLVEKAFACLQDRETESLALADLGTGSGAIACALAGHSRNWRITATDISQDALDLARINAESLGLSNISFLQSSWCEQLGHKKFDLIVSNPPYVAPGDPHLLQDGLEFEPELALVADAQGLAAIQQIAQQSPQYLKKDAWLLLEHGFQQARAVYSLLQQNGFAEISCWQDLAGLDRVTVARYCA